MMTRSYQMKAVISFGIARLYKCWISTHCGNQSTYSMSSSYYVRLPLFELMLTRSVIIDNILNYPLPLHKSFLQCLFLKLSHVTATFMLTRMKAVDMSDLDQLICGWVLNLHVGQLLMEYSVVMKLATCWETEDGFTKAHQISLKKFVKICFY